MADEIREAAPAKINLYLHVTGRRPDGYHLLDSLLAFADIGDEIRVKPASNLSFAIDGPFAEALSTGDENLVVRAARGVRALMETEAGAHITLTKNLPLASGIGGGSADAAAAIRALLRLWGHSTEPQRLHFLALSLGADVPVCLESRSAYFSGIGDIVDLAPPPPPLGLVLVNPLIATATPDVFKARSGDYSRPARLDPRISGVSDFIAALAQRRNDLEAAAMALVPEIGVVLARLDAEPGILLARMSGSGATCFGLYADRQAASESAQRIAADYPNWWVQAGGFTEESVAHRQDFSYGAPLSGGA
ncbi:MAG TPA: 4-(cytidine 5'-diphospho)-2-C-methyl-D-erythritol kinase [Dongiaceae bacterium]|jgi:4-diphosphocytidyl-2-C-methyl-D-erythritol kinase|nr:4-(cytidine 5'-diphospho)-2-C-methyl-D-erythritol kinase [Dongiaceae bacterium]